MFTEKKRKKIELLTYVMIGFVSILALFGYINISKSCKIIDNQANANFISLAQDVKQRENSYFYLAEDETEHCRKALELTIDNKYLNKIGPIAAKYNKYKIPYLGHYLTTIVSPALLYSAHNVEGIRSIYFIIDPKWSKHKECLGLWYTDFAKKGVFKLIDNGPITDMYPESRAGLEWYYVPKKLKRGIWSDPYIDNDIKINMITYSAPVYSGKKFFGIAGVDISIDEIKNFICKLKIYKTGKAYLIDKNNKIIFAKDYKTLTSTYAIDKNLYDFLDKSLTKEGINFNDDDIKIVKSASSKKLFAITRLYNGFVLVLDVPVKELYAETIRLIVLTTFLLLIAIVIVSLITIKANSYIKKMYNELIRKENYTRTVLDNINDGIITINDKFVVESCNPAVEFIFGYSMSEIMGKKLDLLLNYDCDDNDKKVCLLRKETYGIKKNGQKFTVEIDISEIDFEDKKLTLLVVRDITERKEVDRMKNEFISTVSHELRTPLTSISGSLRLIESGLLGKLPDKVGDLINIANNNSSRLINLINDILDMEKMESGKMIFNMDVYEISPIVQQAINLNMSYAEQYGVKINFEQPAQNVRVRVDKERLIQVLTNLISNAAKFSAQEGTINISVSCQDNRLRVSVTDSGNGIEEEFRSRIFDKFTQADSSDTRKVGGTGLGLSISKRIIEQLGGKMDFDTEIGVGSTFYFDLPYIDIV